MNDPYHCLLSDLNQKKLDANVNTNVNTYVNENVNENGINQKIKEPKNSLPESEKNTIIDKDTTNNGKIKEENLNDMLNYFIKKITNSQNIRNTLILTILYIVLNSPLMSNIIKEKAEFLFTDGVYNNLGKILIALILSSVFIFSV